MKHIALLLALVLAGCGGGGGDTASPSPAPSPAPAPSPVPAPAPGPSPTPVTPDGRPARGTFVPAFLDMQVLEGELGSAQVDLQDFIETDQPLSARIELPNIFEPINRVVRYWNGRSNSNVATVTLAKNISPGVHTGTIKVMLCKDLPQNCQQPFLSSPWVLPYRVTIHSIGPRLTTLTPLAGRPKGWTQAYGNANSSSNIETTEVFDPSKFSVRWHIKPTVAKQIDPDFVAEGGVVAIQRGSINTSGRTLEAFSEASGKPLWQQSISSYSKGSVLTKGRVFLLESAGPRGAKLNAYDAATGALLLSKDTTQDANISMVADDDSIYGLSPSFRWDALTGNVIWRVTSTGSFTTFARSVRAGAHIYAYNPDGLQRYSVEAGAQTVLTPTNRGSDHLLVGDKANNLYSTFNSGGWVSIRKFSTESNSQAWQVDAPWGYSTDMPAVDSSLLFLVTRQYPSTQISSISAHSTTDGAKRWGKSLDGLKGNIRFVVAGNLIFISSPSADASRTYALNKVTGEVVWTFPIAGSLALSENGTLYIAGATSFSEGGSLTAINLR